MAVTVIDSKSEITAFQAEMDGLELGAAAIPGVPVDPEKAPAKVDKPPDKPADKQQDPEESDPDDMEGDDGLTARQKRELSAKMLKAIGKKHREMKEAEEFAAAQYSERKLAEQRAATLERELAAVKPTPAAAASDAGKPQRDKFAADEAGSVAYWEAMTDWRVEQKLAQKAQEDAQAAAERRAAEIMETAKERIAKAIAAVPDFREVTESVDAIVPPVVAGYMQKSEMFAELGYHLAKHPEILTSLAKLPADEQLVTIGKIESTLRPFEPSTTESGAKTTDGATPSKAAGKNGQQAASAAPSGDDTGIAPSRARGTAPVIKPLNGSGAAVEVDPRDMNIRETINDWSKRHKVDLGLRKRH